MADDERENFPGLNKGHGFFKAIEKNQVERQTYHEEWKEWRESRRDVVDSEVQQTKSKRKPPKALYRPPHSRENKKTLYKLEIEISPDNWHYQAVQKCGQWNETAQDITTRYSLSNRKRLVLAEMIKEFEQSLNISD